MASSEFTHFNRPVKIPSEYDELIGGLIAERNRRGWSQEHLAHLIGCASSLIHKWETKKRIPSGFLLICWLDALGLEAEIKKVDSDL